MIIFNKDTNDNTNTNKVERVEASVKWYNPEKGYGFLNRGDNSGDIMIHFSSLEKIGCPYIKSRDRVICNVVSGNSGAHVIQVIDVKYGSPEPRSLSEFLYSRLPYVDPEDLEDIEGIIKWYNPDKGFGFIIPDNGGREIFVHFSILRNAGYKFLQPRTRVLAKVYNSERGPETHMIRVLCEEEKEEKKQAS